MHRKGFVKEKQARPDSRCHVLTRSRDAQKLKLGRLRAAV